MQLVALLTTLAGLLSVALANTFCNAEGYVPPTATPTGHPLAVIDTYSTADCHTNDMKSCKLPIYEDGRCFPFLPDTESLVVMGSNKNKLKYNSLRIYHTNNCTGGWSLEPHICQGPNGDGQCACSTVSTYKSIQVVLKW